MFIIHSGCPSKTTCVPPEFELKDTFEGTNLEDYVCKGCGTRIILRVKDKG